MKRTITNPIVKNITTFIKTSAETNGEITIVEVILMPGGHNPLHFHRTFTETFTALEGDLGLKVGRKGKLVLKPGQSLTAKPFELHSFFNPGDKEIKFRVEIKPGHEGFENALRIGYGLAEDGLSNRNAIPKNLLHKALLVVMSDTNLPGGYKLATPVLIVLTVLARRLGFERELIKKYCI